MSKAVRVRRLTSIPLVAALTVGALALPGQVAADNDQLDERTDTVFRVLPDEGRVTSESTTILKNTVKPTTRIGKCKNGKGRCKIRTDYFYESWKGIYVPQSAAGYTIGGPNVTSTFDSAPGSGNVYRVHFPRLMYKKKQKVTSTFEIPAGDVDTSDPTRIEDGYIHFCWFGQSGDRGSVKAILPAGYEPFTYLGGALSQKTAEGVVLSAPKGADVSLWLGCTDAFAPDRLRHTYVVGDDGHSLVTVTSWPDDDEWERSVVDEVEATMSWLEEGLGVPLSAGSVELREIARQARYYHDGDARPFNGYIGLVEDYRAGGAALRLARSWFDAGDFADPWLAEGLAVWASTRALGARCPAATDHPLESQPDLDGTWVEVTLNSGSDDVAVADWQSITTCRLIETGADIVGEEAMLEIAARLLTAPVRVGTDHWLEAVSAGLPDGLDSLVSELEAAGIEV